MSEADVDFQRLEEQCHNVRWMLKRSGRVVESERTLPPAMMDQEYRGYRVVWDDDIAHPGREHGPWSSGWWDAIAKARHQAANPPKGASQEELADALRTILSLNWSAEVSPGFAQNFGCAKSVLERYDRAPNASSLVVESESAERSEP